jgi:hypothetical protein
MKVTGTLTSAAAGDPFDPPVRVSAFNITVWGTFVATYTIERKFDDDDDWFPLTAFGEAIEFTGPMSESWEEAEPAVNYRIRCTAYTSGTLNYRFSV